MDILMELISNKYVLMGLILIVAIIVMKVIKSIVKAVVTVCLIGVVLTFAYQYVDGVKDNFNIKVDDGLMVVKIIDKEYEIDVDYIKHIEVSKGEEGRKIIVKSNKKEIKDIELEVPTIAYYGIIQPLAGKMEIEIVNK